MAVKDGVKVKQGRKMINGRKRDNIRGEIRKRFCMMYNMQVGKGSEGKERKRRKERSRTVI